jgi:membrane associated rhomboid family serine protease
MSAPRTWTAGLRTLGALRPAAALAVCAAILASVVLAYESCDEFGEAPYAHVGVAVVVAAVTGAMTEMESHERVRSAAFAGVLVAVAGAIVLIVVFAADSCSGA